MKKLSKREIIIIGVMSIAVLWGIFMFFSESFGKKIALTPALEASKLEMPTSGVALPSKGNVLSAGEVYVIGRAETEWLHNPFYGNKEYDQVLKLKETEKAGPEVGKGVVKKATFAYTGYMEFGRKKVAIINGVEYTAGESMQEQGYVVKKISPEKVLIESKIEGRTIDVPIRD